MEQVVGKLKSTGQTLVTELLQKLEVAMHGFLVWETKEENLERIHILFCSSATLSLYISFSATPVGSFPQFYPQLGISLDFHPPCPGLGRHHQFLPTFCSIPVTSFTQQGLSPSESINHIYHSNP